MVLQSPVVVWAESRYFRATPALPLEDIQSRLVTPSSFRLSPALGADSLLLRLTAPRCYASQGRRSCVSACLQFLGGYAPVAKHGLPDLGEAAFALQLDQLH